MPLAWGRPSISLASSSSPEPVLFSEKPRQPHFPVSQLPVSPALLTLQLPSLFPPLVPLRPPLLDTSPSLPVPMLPSPTVFTRSYLSFQFQPQ